MHDHAVDQGVEPFGQLPQRPVPFRLGRQLTQFRQFGERSPDVRRPQMREALGDPVDLCRCDPQSQAGVPQGPTGPVGLGHRGDRHPFPAEPVEDRVVALQPPGGLHVDVDIRQ